jgi:hypothetical protein
LKKEIEDGFARVFRAREDAERLANQKRQDTKSREQAFREAFREHLQRIIKPTLESLKQLLEKNGIDATVVESLFTPSVTMSGWQVAPEERPTLTYNFSCPATLSRATWASMCPVRHRVAALPARRQTPPSKALLRSGFRNSFSRY